MKAKKKSQCCRAMVTSGGICGHRKSSSRAGRLGEAQTVVAWQWQWQWQYFGIPVHDLRLPHSPHPHGGKIDGSSNSSDNGRGNYRCGHPLGSIGALEAAGGAMVEAKGGKGRERGVDGGLRGLRGFLRFSSLPAGLAVTGVTGQLPFVDEQSWIVLLAASILVNQPPSGLSDSRRGCMPFSSSSILRHSTISTRV